MTNLVTIENNQVVVSSRQVAESFVKFHKDVLENIREILAAENSATRFFNESTFENRGKSYPEYIMNRDGFTLLAMSFTGSKAMQWKLKYIQAFNEMEQQLNKPMTQLEILVQSAQTLLDHEKQLNAITSKIEDTVSILSVKPNEWRKDCGDLLKKTAYKIGGIEHYSELQTEAYQLLNDRFHVDLSARLTRKKKRAIEDGTSTTRVNQLNKLDVIAEDKKLIEAYISICKDIAVKYALASEVA